MLASHDCYLDVNVFESMRAIGEPGDRFVFEIYKVFLEQSEKVLKDMDEANQRSDAVTIKQLAHRLKGSAANLGATALSNKAAIMEQEITASSSDLAEDIRELSRIFEATSHRILISLETGLR